MFFYLCVKSKLMIHNMVFKRMKEFIKQLRNGENVIPHEFRHGIDTLNQSLHLLSSAPDSC